MKTALPVRSCVLAVLLGATSLAQADSGYFGGTGLFKVPTASVLDEGRIDVQANAHNPAPGILLNPETYAITVGAWPGLEVTGRLFGAHQRTGVRNRDLSIDLKYGLALLDGRLRVAAGLRDPNGEAQKFRARWVALTGQWHGLEPTLGFGTGPDLLNGAFGGLSWRVLPQLRVLADHDGDDWNAGVRIDSGRWFGGLRLVASASWSEAAHGPEGGLALAFPAGREVVPPAPVPPSPVPAARADPPVRAAGTATDRASLDGIRRLAARLVDAGFESVHAGRRADGSVLVLFENRRLNHSMLDAYGVAMASLAATPELGTAPVDLVLTRIFVPMLTVRTDARRTRTFFDEGRWTGTLADVQHGGADPGPAIEWLEPAAPVSVGELVVEPKVRSFVATERGMLDIGTAARLRLTLPMARGLGMSVGALLPLYQTDDFDNRGTFDDFAPEAGLDQALLQYLHRPAPALAWLWSLGTTSVVNVDAPVVALEQLWMSPSGRHQLHVKLMALETSFDSHQVALTTWRWWHPESGVSVSMTGGRFLMGEGGGRIELARFFGDTEVGLFFKAVSRTEAAGGVFLSLPLTPRREAAPGPLFLVKGAPRWGHRLTTTLNSPDQRNPLRPLLLFEPVLELDLRRDLFDAGRLAPATLESGGARLWDAGRQLGAGGG